MADIAEIGFRAETDDLEKAKKDLEDLVPAAGKAEGAAAKVSGALDKVTGAVTPARSAIAALTLALKALGSAVAVGAYVKLADTWSDLSARVGLATGNIDNSAGAMSRLSDMARRTFSSLETTANAFTENATSLRELGYSTSQSLDYLEALNNALVVSGAKGQRAESVQNALSKAMALGKLSGENLNTVIQSGGRIAEILAEKLGVTTNKLRSLGEEGKITSDVLYKAMTGALEKLREEADSMPATIADSFQIIRNSLLQLVGTFDKLTGISGFVALQFIKFGDALKFVADSLPTMFAYIQYGIDIISALANGVMAAATSFVEFSDVFTEMFADITQFSDSVLALIPSLQQVGIVLAIVFGPLVLAGLAALTIGVIQLTASIAIGLVGAIASATAAMLTFLLSNPFTAIPIAIGVALAAIYVFRDAIADALGVDVITAAKIGINAVVGGFVGGFNALSAVWSTLPAVIGDAAISAANAALSAIAKMVNGAISGINSMIAAIPAWMRPGSGGITFKMDEGATFDNPFSGAATEAAKKMGDAMKSALNVDYVGAAVTKFGELTANVKLATNAVTGLGNAAKGGGAAAPDDDSGGSGGAAEKLTELQKIAAEFTKLSEPFTQATAAVKAAHDALTNGIISNDAYASSLSRIEAAFMKVGGSAEQWKKILSKNTDDISKSLETLEKKTLTDLGNEFIDLAVDGKANFEKLAKSIVKDLLKIMWQALVVKPLLGFLKFGDGGWFGGGASSVGAPMNITPNADGGAYGPQGVQAFADGGSFTNSIVSKPTPFTFASGGALGVMGEAGPEAIMPLSRASDGRLGVEMMAAQGGGTKQNGNNVVVIVENNANNTNVREERSTNSDGDEIRRIIIDTVSESIANGELDSVNAARYGSKVQRVAR